jgi:hypothetical protein
MTQAADDVIAERTRQVEREGFSHDHDDDHTDGAIAMAAACYAPPHRIYRKEDYAEGVHFVDPWPWEWRSDKRPHNGNEVRSNGAKGEKYRRSLLVKAGALILAEIERIDRATANPEAAK